MSIEEVGEIKTRIITQDEFQLSFKQFLTEIERGAVFIYPTDTIYGIGCNALNHESVQKIRVLKGNSTTPFSIIAPSLAWIKEHLEMNAQADEWLQKLPGPYTLIFKKRKKDCVAEAVTGDLDSLGVRIPQHWIRKVVEMIGIPFVTTSVNKTGKEFMTNLDDVDPDILAGVSFMIDEGEKKAYPSTIVYLNKEELMVQERRSRSSWQDRKA